MKIFLLILVVLYAGVYIYVSANKKSIINDITDDIGSKLNGDVHIGDAELSFFSSFPTVSVVLTDVSIKDTLFANHLHPFFKAEKVFARMGFWKLIRKKPALTGLKIRNGAMYLFTDSTGYTNKYLLNPKKDTTATPSNAETENQFKRVELSAFQLTMDDRQKGKLYDFMANDLEASIKQKDKTFLVAVRSDILVHNLVFNPAKGSFIKEKKVKGKYDLSYDLRLKQLQFDDINLEIGDHPFNLTGRFDFGEIPGRIPLMDLKVNTKKIEYEFAKSLLTVGIARGLSVVSLSSELTDVSASITGPLKGGEQLVVANWATKKTNIKNPLLDIQNADFTGMYTNEVVPGLPRKDANSKIELRNFSGEWQELPVAADKITITDFTDPLLICDLKSSFPLKKLNTFFSNSSIGIDGGDALVNISYRGPIKKNTSGNSFVNGVVTIKDGLLTYNPRNITLKNVNGDILFRNSDLFVQKLRCVVLNNQVAMDGVAKNLLSLMNTEPNKVILDWNIYSPALNLASFTSLLKPRKKIMTRNNSAGGIGDIAKKIDDVLERGSINVSLRADKLSYNKFEAYAAVANVAILQNSWEIQRVSLQHAGGRMDIQGSLVDKGSNYHQAKVNVQLQQVDVSKTFAAFNNFGQDGITAASLRGKLSAGVDVMLGLDDDGNVSPSSVEGVVDFSLKDGALIDYEPIKKIQDVVFKKRDFANIEFAELKNHLAIKNREIQIDRMEIQSTVLTMFIEGNYSMKGNTDLSIQVPLSNLKKRDKTYVPENVGTDKKGGMSIFIRGTPGPDGNVKFKYDMFKKFRKEK